MTGVTAPLDEIHQNQVEDCARLPPRCSTRSARAAISFVGVGLAASVSDIVNDDVLTFLRRAERHALGSVQRSDVQRAFREPIETAGRKIGDAALQVMVDGAGGYPFLLQLVGAQTWRWPRTTGRPRCPMFNSGSTSTSTTPARYRLRLIAAELIYSTRRGYVDFALPYLREYLRERAVADV